MTTKKSIAFGVALTALSWLASESVRAHHSFAMFDGDRVVVLRGTMLSFSYMNPHSWISMMVPSGSADPEVRWDVEATSPGTLAAQGIYSDTFKIGDKMTVGIRPLRDERHGGSLVFVVDAEGKTYGADPEALGLKVADLKPR